MNLFQYLKSVLNNMMEPQTINLYNREKFPNGEADYVKSKQPSPQPSAFAQAVQQRELPKEEIKLVPVSQKSTESIMNGGNSNPTSGGKAKARNPNFSKFKVGPEVEDAIMKAAGKYSLPPELLFDIALQESSYDPSLVNDTPAGREAGNPTGLYQFTDNTWNDILSRYNNKPGMTLNLANTNRQDPYTNAQAAAYLIKNGQLGKWDASEGVWGNYWSPQELEQLGAYKQSQYHVPGMRASVRLGEGE